MKRIVLLLAILSTSLVSSSQGKLSSEDFDISMSYPEGWRHNPQITAGGILFSLNDARQEVGDMKLMIAFTIVAAESIFKGDLKLMSEAYRIGLKARAGFEKTKIISEEIIDFKGVKAIDITGQANVPIANQKGCWRILLFEYDEIYFEVSAFTSKKEFKMKSVQKDLKFMFDSIVLD
ncbi:MAG: hypothetical protein BM555_03705 [Crocinitomix sp. MedPE-SWsnd]|nr:MAG: hypothetical protein BM555_03705 [Crocinitomix sp. MedPE-SWsnd]